MDRDRLLDELKPGLASAETWDDLEVFLSVLKYTLGQGQIEDGEYDSRFASLSDTLKELWDDMDKQRQWDTLHGQIQPLGPAEDTSFAWALRPRMTTLHSLAEVRMAMDELRSCTPTKVSDHDFELDQFRAQFIWIQENWKAFFPTGFFSQDRASDPSAIYTLDYMKKINASADFFD
jgi:hypothetical protein